MLLREEGFQKPNPPNRVAASLTDSNGAEVSISPTKGDSQRGSAIRVTDEEEGDKNLGRRNKCERVKRDCLMKLNCLFSSMILV